MRQPRLPRFKRALRAAAFTITERDREIIRLVHEHRFLRSNHIASLLAQSPQSVLRRLQLLYHHAFLERPRCQLDYYHSGGGSRHIIYGLGSRGAALLREEYGGSLPSPRSGEQNRGVGRIFLEHAVMVSEVMVALELACRQRGTVRLLQGDQLHRRTGSDERKSFRWGVNIRPQIRLGVVPDRAFALYSEDHDADQNPTYFFLEADRGTMPVRRKNLVQTSFFRKLLAYQATWQQGIHKKEFGINRFRVLTVTGSAERARSLVEACSELRSGHGLFLFTDIQTFQAQPDLLNLTWQTGRPGVSAKLLE